MFALRGLALSLSVFLIVYCALSLALSLTWRSLRAWLQHYSLHRAAGRLFALRMFPFVTAVVITIAFTVPSFLLLEPRTIDEPLGGIPLALAIAGVCLGLLGLCNAMRAWLRASRAVSVWWKAGEPAACEIDVPVWRTRIAAPPLIAAGILRPRILVTSSTESALNRNEFCVALNHEVAHVRRRDNLKKLLFRFLPFPGMRGLETAWLEATEMAADDAAVSNASQALDLASALIKLSRISPAEPPADLTAALVHSPSSIMNARVERLIAWSETRPADSKKYSLCRRFGVAVAALVAFGVSYPQLLSQLHEATEWMMR